MNKLYVCFSLVLSICLFGCGLSDRERLTHSWSVGLGFSDVEYGHIVHGIDEWVYATDGLFSPEDVMLAPIEHDTEFGVTKIGENNLILLSLEVKYNSKLDGWYSPDDDHIVFVNNRITKESVIHEFGHFLGLGHFNGCDVMSFTCEAKCISQLDINELCKLHDCSGFDMKTTCDKR